MKILFYDTKAYDKASFEEENRRHPAVEIDYLKTDLAPRTAPLAEGYDAVCAFVNSDVGTETVEALQRHGVRLILMRCAGLQQRGSGGGGPMRHSRPCGCRAILRRRWRSTPWRWLWA